MWFVKKLIIITIHYYKMWVQFTRLVNLLKIQWNHLAYKDTFCCSDKDLHCYMPPFLLQFLELLPCKRWVLPLLQCERPIIGNTWNTYCYCDKCCYLKVWLHWSMFVASVVIKKCATTLFCICSKWKWQILA
jgi:hypothetical protein